MTSAPRVVEHVTCLGCGCACDDIALVIHDNRIDEARHACPLGTAWFGDGSAPARVLVSGRDASLEEALDTAARLLGEASRPLVYLAPDLSCEAQREYVALADLLRATLDSVTSATTLRSLLAVQERGTAGATLGEIRNRADLLLCWGADPAVRYPRYWTRYAPEPAGLHVPEGRRSRTVIAVDVGDARGPADADRRFAVTPGEEVAVLTWLRQAVERPAGLHGVTADSATTGAPVHQSASRDGGGAAARDLAAAILAARYAVVVTDAEPDAAVPERDSGRADALVALAQAMNGHTRGALSVLRAGGNRSGADAVMTWQTGYPAAVDFSRGYPRYRPIDGTAVACLARGEVDAMLMAGAADALPVALEGLAGVPLIVIGPRASESPLRGAAVTIDTGTAGIHEAGMALRMDDVPLPLGGAIRGPHDTMAITRALGKRIVTVRHGARSR